MLTSTSRSEPRPLSQQAEPTFYSQLELECFADSKLVKKAYHRLALLHHPDKGGDENRFKQISHAYYVLSDATLKAEYDELLRCRKSVAEFTVKIYQDFDRAMKKFFDQVSKEFDERAHEKTNIKLSPTPLHPHFFNLFHPERLQIRHYYIVGAPINISRCKGELRDQIPPHEIMASFHSMIDVILFENEYSALMYSQSTRQGNFYEDVVCYQSPIAKVKVLQPIHDQPYSLDYWINEKYNDEIDGSNRSSGTLRCLNAKMNNLKIYTSRMLVQTAKPDQFFREYPIVEFARPNQIRNGSPEDALIASSGV